MSWTPTRSRRIDYFARTGNWTHQWTTLRNLADLLRRLGDHEPATLLTTAADHAPDAPAADPAPDTPTADRATGARPRHTAPASPIPSRAAVLDTARQAIERNLTRP